MNEVYLAICDLVTVLNNCSVDYVVGGSVCSSVHGTYRTTNDIDVLVNCEQVNLQFFSRELKNEFIVDDIAFVANLKNQRSFNIFHEKTALKVDLFVAKNDFNLSELKRGVKIKPAQSPCEFRIASAEDIIIAKLLWFYKSNSERQLNDIAAVIKMNSDLLDYSYIKKWGASLNLSEALEKLLP